MIANIAILVFTREAGKEALCKGFSSRLNSNKGKEIAASLISNTIACAAKSGLPYFIISSAAQEGNCFGERFRNAFQSIFARGFNAVIAIGTDCPGLKTSDIRSAADTVSKGAAVLGPAGDGGTWLTTLTSDQFEQLDFGVLPWNTGMLCSSLEMALASLEQPYLLLSRKGDVDSIEDIFAEGGKHLWLRRLLRCLITRDCRSALRFYTLFLPSSLCRRGPPEFLLIP